MARKRNLICFFFLLQDKTVMTAVFIISWLLKNFTWLTILIQNCEKFYSAVQSVQDTCTLFSKSSYSGYSINVLNVVVDEKITNSTEHFQYPYRKCFFFKIKVY